MGRLPHSEKTQRILDAATKRLKRCVDAEAHNRMSAIEDLKFVNGDQWNPDEKKRRSDKGRPALQFNMLPKFVDQVVGDMLHMMPKVKVRPADTRADAQIAKIYQGIISQVEYQSNSKAVYGYAAKQMVSCGYGAWRVLTRYCEENPFVQEMYLESVRNPFLAYLDPDAKDQFGADAKFGFVLQKMSRDEFEDTYPDATWPGIALKHGQGLANEQWYDGDTATVAEYFTVEKEPEVMVQLETGEVVPEDEFKRMVEEWEEASEEFTNRLAVSGPKLDPMGQGGQPQIPSFQQPPMPQMPPQGAGPQQPPMQPPPTGLPPQGPQPPQQQPLPQPLLLAEQAKHLGPKPTAEKRRTTEKVVIRHRIITGTEILEGGFDGDIFPGRFIPIIIVKGKELNIEGKNYVYSLIRHAKDPQKLLNHWHSSAAEVISLSPKTPWLGTSKQFEGYEQDYAAANVENMPFLKYNVDPEAPGMPQRIPVPQPPAAIFEQIRKCEDSIKSTIGMFNADVGAPGSEQTGAAIMARQRPGDIATFEFSENLARAILYTGRVMVEIIPEIYDSERDVRVRNMDETDSLVPVNTTLGTAYNRMSEKPEVFSGMDLKKIEDMLSVESRQTRFNDVTVGKYDTVVTTGPSYATQRQEAAEHLMRLAQSMPNQMAGAADLIVRNLDFKDADELEERLRKPMLLSGMIAPRNGETMPRPPNPNPQQQAQMAEAQSKQQIAQLKLQIETLKLEEQKMKLQLELAKAKKELADDEKSAGRDLMDRDRRYRLDADRLSLDREEFEHRRAADISKHVLDVHDRMSGPSE